MTSKELIEAATWTIGIRNAISKKAVACAEYILATVRADDDEPVTADWMEDSWPECLSEMIRWGCDSGVVCLWTILGEESFMLRVVTTRGDMRAFCRVLGIELKEDDQ